MKIVIRKKKKVCQKHVERKNLKDNRKYCSNSDEERSIN